MHYSPDAKNTAAVAISKMKVMVREDLVWNSVYRHTIRNTISTECI